MRTALAVCRVQEVVPGLTIVLLCGGNGTPVECRARCSPSPHQPRRPPPGHHILHVRCPQWEGRLRVDVPTLASISADARAQTNVGPRAHVTAILYGPDERDTDPWNPTHECCECQSGSQNQVRPACPPGHVKAPAVHTFTCPLPVFRGTLHICSPCLSSVLLRSPPPVGEESLLHIPTMILPVVRT